MKNTIMYATRRLLALSVAVAVCACVAESETPQTVTVEGVRPVAKAVEKLEQIYNVPITYEDIRYVHESEMKSDDQGRSIIKGGAVSFTHRTPVTSETALGVRNTQAVNAVAEVLKSYNATRGTEVFTVIAGDEALHVVPVQSTDTSGRMERIQPLLDTRVSIPPGQRTAEQVIDEIAKSLSDATGRVIGTGTLEPRAAFRRHKTDITASNEPAHSVLARLFKEIPVGYTSRPNKAGGFHLVPSSLSW
jgi:hypothetical protein